ncbi:phage tail assembly protein [Methylobacterium dankookense]|uniref:Phage tail assembly protein n=1 Tax=Methylobacterium dankookense TaxID=560405 RepID=A0A564G862_9HYPH|nr:phage tail assembly protein [Methylobacterium dankookense]GJD59714.1 hypothetical protein IFDJLNFL_5645 [Methylobacterium dankookense]VUF16108.1 hypothetical protein MTDSW087_05859 [Methylobacterium dankookense]
MEDEAQTVRDPMRIELSRSYEGLDGAFAELKFREPQARDFISSGLPVEMVPSEDGFDVRFKPEQMTRFLAKIAGRLPADIQMLSPNDWMAAAYACVPFFIPGARKPPSAPPSTSP